MYVFWVLTKFDGHLLLLFNIIYGIRLDCSKSHTKGKYDSDNSILQSAAMLLTSTCVSRRSLPKRSLWVLQWLLVGSITHSHTIVVDVELLATGTTNYGGSCTRTLLTLPAGGHFLQGLQCRLQGCATCTIICIYCYLDQRIWFISACWCYS